MIALVLLTAVLTVIVPVVGFVLTQSAAKDHMASMDAYEAKVIALEQFFANRR